jgi:hypothetical protein
MVGLSHALLNFGIDQAMHVELPRVIYTIWTLAYYSASPFIALKLI